MDILKLSSKIPRLTDIFIILQYLESVKCLIGKIILNGQKKSIGGGGWLFMESSEWQSYFLKSIKIQNIFASIELLSAF